MYLSPLKLIENLVFQGKEYLHDKIDVLKLTPYFIRVLKATFCRGLHRAGGCLLKNSMSRLEFYYLEIPKSMFVSLPPSHSDIK